MSGFSIELLEEGYRAIDPIARVRFVVKRMPDDAPLTAPLVIATSGTGSVAPGPPSTDAPASKRPPAVTTASIPTRPAPIDKGTNVATPAAIGSALPGLPSVKVLSSREQDPTDASPLTYREYSFAVPAGTSEETAVRILRGQLALVDAQIAGAKMGKLVNLAAFDVEFTGKPPKPPIVTLTWKDWKGEPVLRYPLRDATQNQAKPPAGSDGGTSNGPPSTASPASSLFPPASLPPPAFLQSAASPTAPAMFPAPATTAPPAPAPPPPTHVSAPPPPPAHVSAAPPADAVVLPARRPSSPEGVAPPADGMVQTPSGRFVRGRTKGDELITALFESMHDLHFLRDALDGGQFCLALATEMLPARAALIHFFDLDKREWVIACARGKDTSRLLTSRAAESDELLREAARHRRAIVTPDATAASAQRYRSLGGSRSIIIAPIMQAGRALGAIEIINPLDGMPFTEDEGNAMTYIAEQYAGYLGSRGIVLDHERIQNAAAPR